MTVRRIVLTIAAGVLAVATLLPGPATAQTLTAGIKGGVNIANVALTTDEDIETARVTRAIAGAFVGIDKNNRGGLLVEFFFTQKGTKASFVEDSSEISNTLHVDYIEIPVVGRLTARRDSMTAHFFFGPAFAFKVRQSEKIEVDGVEIPDVGDETEIRRRDISVTLGVTLDIQRCLIEGRYTHGLVNVTEEGDSDVAKSRTFSVLFGYRFK